MGGVIVEREESSVKKGGQVMCDNSSDEMEIEEANGKPLEETDKTKEIFDGVEEVWKL